MQCLTTFRPTLVIAEDPKYIMKPEHFVSQLLYKRHINSYHTKFQNDVLHTFITLFKLHNFI